MSFRSCLSIGSFYSKRKKSSKKNHAAVDEKKYNTKTVKCLDEETIDAQQVHCNILSDNLNLSPIIDDKSSGNGRVSFTADFAGSSPGNSKESNSFERNSQTSLLSEKASQSSTNLSEKGFQNLPMEALWKKIKFNVLDERNSKNMLDNERIDLEECGRLLEKPSLKNLIKMNGLLNKCTPKWLVNFLQGGCLQLMFEALTIMNNYRYDCLNNAVTILQMVSCIKTVISNHVGIEYLLDDKQMVVHNLVPSKFNNVFRLCSSYSNVLKIKIEMLFAYYVRFLLYHFTRDIKHLSNNEQTFINIYFSKIRVVKITAYTYHHLTKRLRTLIIIAVMEELSSNRVKCIVNLINILIESFNLIFKMLYNLKQKTFKKYKKGWATLTVSASLGSPSLVYYNASNIRLLYGQSANAIIHLFILSITVLRKTNFIAAVCCCCCCCCC